MTILAPVALALLASWSSSGPSPLPDSVSARQRAVESGLLPRTVEEGEAGWALGERMAHYHVPGLSLAVLHDGRIAWAAGYGVKRAGGTDPVTAATLFQAASISKPLTATATLRLVDQGRLDLDRDVGAYLRSWHLPEGAQTPERRVTLRRLLSHSAGTNVHGFGGVPPGTDLPGAAGVLEGRAGTDPVRVTTRPGTAFRYSGGGYQIVQMVLEDVTGEPFADVMQRLVLDPIGMARSTFEQPLPDSLVPDAAAGHRQGDPLAGGWMDQPARAAAGLWTTPTDLARFALGLGDAWLGRPGAILSQQTARVMMTPGLGGWGLGVPVSGGGEGEEVSFGHGGDNPGYSAFLVYYPDRGEGVAVMANGMLSGPLLMEVVRAVARVYDWPPEYRAEVRTPPLDGARRALPWLAAVGLAGLALWGMVRRRAKGRNGPPVSPR